MKILLLNTEKTWRGGERQTLYTLEGLKRKGFEVSLLCLKNYPLYFKTLNKGFHIYGVNNNLQALHFLIKKGKNFHILHCQTAKTQTIAVVSKPFHKRPVIYTRRVDFLPKGYMTRLKYLFTDRIVAISEEIKELLNRLNLRKEIIVIPSCVVEKELNKERAKRIKDYLNIREKKIIATVAALVPHKDPYTMVETIRRLFHIRKDFAFLHFGDGELKKEIETKISKYHLGEVYFLLGHHEDVEDYFSIFDVFVMSSSQEGLGSSVLDAFIYKVPVVATEAGGLKETVEGRGLLCKPKDAECLAIAIDRLLEDQILRKRLIDKAYEDVKKFYSLESMIDKYVETYRSLIKNEI
jgi:glycosyltransferase involved in cell wall biosynthesis